MTTRAINEKTVAECFEDLAPKVFRHKPPTIESVSMLALGESNLNFLVSTDRGEYVFRINMDPASAIKSVTEFKVLNALKGQGIAPAAIHLEESKDRLGATFLIVQYIEGRPLSMIETDSISKESAARLAPLVAAVHRIDAKRIPVRLPSRGLSYENWFARMRKDIEYIKRNRRSRSLDRRFDRLIEDGFNRLHDASRQSAPENAVAPGHGDICAQNVVVGSRGTMHLIDWENFGLWDPAAEIAMVFEAFGLDFPSDCEEGFLRAYGRIRFDETINERLRVFRPIVRFEQLTWGIRHVFEIANGEMNRAFLEATVMSKHLAFVDSCLTKLVKTGLIDASFNEIRDFKVFPPGLD